MESLYRKYRPLTFESVVGQQHIVSTLEHAVTEGRLSHAYLFCGPRGTGKTTMARILAKALLCQHAEAARAEGAAGCMPDGTCAECRSIAEGTHPDVYELDAASRTGVDNVREEIIGSVSFAPVRGAYKIYIIDEVHMLTTAAFNALLKTLEEPPAHVVFVLCTTDPQKIPETILSRCQRFEFHRIGNDDIVARLAYICREEGFAFDDEALQVVAKHARGGMRDALSTLEQLSVFGAGAVRAADARALLGEVAGDVLADFSRAIARRDVVELFNLTARQVDEGNDLMELTRDLVAHLRDVYMVRVAGARPGLLDGTPEELVAVEEEAEAFEGTDRLARVLTVLDDAALEMRTAPDTRLVLEIALTRLARPEADLTLEALAERLDRIEAQLAAGIPAAVASGAPAAQPVSAAPAAPAAAAPSAAASPEPHAAPVPKPAPAPVSAAVPAAAAAPTAASTSAPRPVSSRPATAAAPESVPVQPAVAVPEPATPKPAAASVPVAKPAATATPGTAPASDPAPAPAPVAKPAAGGDAVTDAAELQRRWAEVVKRVTAAQASRGSLLLHARAAADDGDTLTVSLPAGSGFAIRMLAREDTQQVVLPQVSAVFGQRRISYVMEGTASAPASTSAAASAAAPTPTPASAAPEVPVEVASPAPAMLASDAAPASDAVSEPAHAPAPDPAAPPSVPAPEPAPASATAAEPEQAAPAQRDADQTSAPTILPEPDVDAQRAAWEAEEVPYDDAYIASFSDEEDLPPFDMPAASTAPAAPAADAAPEAGPAPAIPDAMPEAPGDAAPQASEQPFTAAPLVPSGTEPAGPPASVEDAKDMISNIFGAATVFKTE